MNCRMLLLLIAFLSLEKCFCFKLCSRQPTSFRSFNRFTRIVDSEVSKLKYTPQSLCLLQATESRDGAEIEDSDDIKDKQLFFNFFDQKNHGDVDMTKDQFLEYPEVKELLDSGTVYMDDLDDLWNSVVADASGLNKEEAYEMLCMVRDLPDPEDAQFLDKEFEKLTASPPTKSRRSKKSSSQEKDAKSGLSYLSFLNWSDVQEIISEDILTLEEVTNIWRQVVGDLDAKVDRLLFGRLNRALDDAIEAKEAANSEEKVERVDPWALDFDPTKVFSDESFNEIRDYFEAVTAGKSPKLFSFSDLATWPDIKEVN